MDSFFFQGFLPRESELRIQQLKVIDRQHRPCILMDTPYRLEKTVTQILEVCGNRQIVLGTNLTQQDEYVYTGTCESILKKIRGQKKEFLLLIL